jgi:hypothetical protein
VIVDRVTEMLSPAPFAASPLAKLLAIVEFRTMMLTVVEPVELAIMPLLLLFALTLSLTVILMVAVPVVTSSPDPALFSISTWSRTPVIGPVPVGPTAIPSPPFSKPLSETSVFDTKR